MSQVPPKPVVRLGLAILRGVNWIQNSIVPAPMRIADLSFGGYTLSEVVRTAAALGIADKLAQGPMTAEALADDIGASADATSLVCHGLYAQAIRLLSGVVQTTQESLHRTHACTELCTLAQSSVHVHV